MRKRDKTSAKKRPADVKRGQRVVCLLSEEELRMLSRYLDKYDITNRSRWMRETLMRFILKNMNKDYPTLFGENEMRR